MAEEKRVNYFQGMMLVDQDFKDDQTYHRRMRHNHNLELHTWGVVRGLEVTIDRTAVTVAEGLAIDATGKEIWWAGGAIQPAGSAAEGTYLVIESVEEFRDDYPQMKGKYLRLIDTAKFSWKNPKADGDVVLAQLTQGQPDASARRTASSVRAIGINIEMRPVMKEGSLRFMTGAPLNERLTIGPTGNVGIGTTDPKARLHLKFPDVVGGNAAVLNLEGTDHVYMQFFPLGFAAGRKAWMGYESANEKNFKIQNEYPDGHLLLASGSGKVGIGTSKPGFTLQVGDTDNVVDARLCVAGKGDTGNFRQWTLRTGDKADATVDAAKMKEIHKLRLRDEQATADRLVIDQDGNVGLGVSNPQNRLEVRGHVAIREGMLKFTDDKGDSYPDNWIGMATGVEGTTKWLHIGGITDASARRLALYADITYMSGKLGIGTTSPQDRLQVGDGYSRICINPSPKGADQNLYDADYGTAYLGLNVIKATNKWHRDGDGTTNNGASLIYNTIKGQLCFVTLEPGSADLNASEIVNRKRMVIDERGVGIGTSDLGSSKFKIAKSASDFVNVRFVDTGMGQFEIVGWSGGWNINAMTNEKNLYLNRDSAEKSNVLIGRSGKELFVRGSNGNVGIGTSDPQAKLVVRGGETLVQLGNFWTFGDSGNGVTHIDPPSVGVSGVAPGDTVEMAGVRRVVSAVSATNLTVSPAFPYNGSPIPVYVVRPGPPFRADDTKGNPLFSISGQGDATITGRVSCGGWIAFKTFHGSYVTANDDKSTMRQNRTRENWEQFTLEMACSREFKENISDLTAGEAMATLQNLRPIKYDYKCARSFRQNLGFIAEEMPDNLASEDRKSVSPFEVIPVLTRVAKEQEKSIARLQETIRALQEEVRRNLVATVPTTGPILKS